MDELPKYSKVSSFVQKYAVSGSGLEKSVCASDTVNSSERVVILDAFLRRHYTTVTSSGLQELTEFNEEKIENILSDFEKADILNQVKDGYQLNRTNDCVHDLKEIQKDLMGRMDK